MTQKGWVNSDCQIESENDTLKRGPVETKISDGNSHAYEVFGSMEAEGIENGIVFFVTGGPLRKRTGTVTAIPCHDGILQSCTLRGGKLVEFDQFWTETRNGM